MPNGAMQQTPHHLDGTQTTDSIQSESRHCHFAMQSSTFSTANAGSRNDPVPIFPMLHYTPLCREGILRGTKDCYPVHHSTRVGAAAVSDRVDESCSKPLKDKESISHSHPKLTTSIENNISLRCPTLPYDTSALSPFVAEL